MHIKESLWDKYKEPYFSHRRFKHKDIVPLIEQSSLEKEVVGRSFEQREIYKLRWGNGPVSILMWSQMHGNEATATMALFDLMHCLATEPELQHLQEQLSIHIVPMLNPDGAERFQRRTAQDIDMNRDALAQATPEGKLLAALQHELKPDFSFNLHDQDIRYAAGEKGEQTAIAFLATAFDESRGWNPTRTKAAQVIVGLNAFLQAYIPSKIAKFSDEFEPRAFGDCIQQWGSSLILIESGGYGNNTEKMYLRKLNFLLYLKAFELIADNSYRTTDKEPYEQIPLNTRSLFNLLIKNATWKGSKVDIGINLTEINTHGATKFRLDSVIEDMGDLSLFGGISVFDASDYEIQDFSDFVDFQENVPKEHLDGPKFEEKAYFVLTKSGKPCYIIINGILNEL